MRFIHTHAQKEGTQALADKIVSFLNKGNKVLWLIPGGSNIPISVEAMDIIRKNVEPIYLRNLSIALTDERYGPVGHPDSNWKQLMDAGMDFDILNKLGVRSIPVLVGSSLSLTVSMFGDDVEKTLKSVDVVVGQFGMGADGHIAGILPHSPAVTDTVPAFGYESKPFTRITLTPRILEQVDVAYAFVSGDSKKAAIERLRNETVSIDEQPAQILKDIPEAYIYIDK